jgi:hypothetical protein
MHMIALHREVHEPKSEPLLPFRQSLAHLPKEHAHAQRRHAGHDAQSDVHRMMPGQRRTAQMRNARGAPLWRPTRAFASSAPGTKAESELTASRHELD